MKCAACGYEGKWQTFIAMGSGIQKTLDNNNIKYIPYSIYACPKCGTVRIDKEEKDG